jgi:hypothetical protein
MDEDSGCVQDETPKKGTEVSESVSAPEVRSEPAFSEAPGDSGSLTEAVADKKPEEVNNGRNTKVQKDGRQAGRKRTRAIQRKDGPSASSPEFAAYFEEIVRTSGTLPEAVRRLGYHQATTVRYHMRRFGVRAPDEWRRRPHLAAVARRNVPEVVILTPEARSWVASIVQGEGCIQSRYEEDDNYTYLVLDVLMVDPAPIVRLSEYVGLKPPSKPVKNHQWKRLWHRNIAGLRALRVLQEITPYLVGQKRREAERAMSFFSPVGLHRGCFRNGDIWPHNEFPLRSKKHGAKAVPHTTAVPTPTTSLRSSLFKRKVNPESVISNVEDRYWIAGLVQGEGCIESFYAAMSDRTASLLTVGMTDSASVFRFSDLVGLPRPTKPRDRGEHRPIWRKSIVGMRAIRILREIEPLLQGEKLREAERALTFFDQNGYHEGCARPMEIWPTSEFPMRRRQSSWRDMQKDR